MSLGILIFIQAVTLLVSLPLSSRKAVSSMTIYPTIMVILLGVSLTSFIVTCAFCLKVLFLPSLTFAVAAGHFLVMTVGAAVLIAHAFLLYSSIQLAAARVMAQKADSAD